MTDAPVAQDVADRIAKLLRLADKAGTPEEAAAAAAKAQTLLVQYNLTMADVAETEAAGLGSGKRKDEMLRGGFYAYERQLWRAVAELNFCLYFTVRERVERVNPTARELSYKSLYARRWRRMHKHRLVGRAHNVAATQAMGGYLLQSIERILRERLRVSTHHASGFGQDQTNFRSRWAVSFREGAVETVVQKLEDRRREILDAERAARRRAVEAASRGVSTATALTLQHYVDAETDANMDFIHGAGWSAKRAALRAQAAAEAAAEAKAHAEWAAAHPEEAAARAKAEAEESERYWRRRRGGRRSYSSGDPKDRRRDWSAFRAGQEAGDAIGLDPQTDDARARRAIA